MERASELKEIKNPGFTLKDIEECMVFMSPNGAPPTIWLTEYAHEELSKAFNEMLEDGKSK